MFDQFINVIAKIIDPHPMHVPLLLGNQGRRVQLVGNTIYGNIRYYTHHGGPTRQQVESIIQVKSRSSSTNVPELKAS